MYTTERKHGGWFVLRDDDSIMGNIEAEGGGFRAYSVFENGDRDDVGLFQSKREAELAINDEDWPR